MTIKVEQFVETVWTFYRAHGRHSLPWRKSRNPYRVLVSEIMLQQTQVERVIPKYQAFIKRFPTVTSLAASSLHEVLAHWQGLGYNRRAKMLHNAAKVIVREYGGRFPKTVEVLRALPGVGTYTASAVMVFAYATPQVLIETNVRTVFLHHFFAGRTGVSDTAILKLVTKTLPVDRSREWYAALMDYGSHLKRLHGNANRRSAAYKKQSTFKGSDRQVRGAIVRMLVKEKASLALPALLKCLVEFDPTRVATQLQSLVEEGLIVCSRGRYHLPQ